jgi:sugar (pentulose or hexulose) kinase
VGQRFLAAALNSPISVMETAGEGGAWGIALLGSYMANGSTLSLPDFLDKVVFAGNTGTQINPDPAEVAGFEAYLANYKAALPVEAAAVKYKK